ncbi:hypothetical protein A1O1_01287 [Capronia coronata CBS 617.96]|uniref:NCS1 family nucleobase:cation symporter-1 n=1 Tax=Capronia coronata CBS 617.96 TaxID=1182541 RepID=W9Z3K0_9EURO|nr:uncharacterized protein A1O1_01287 [Capronia coronata CBS 617.96]EXJ96161.1 hypothetical protein A1O1_01287 [Capronia coronata CBS 617.96]
MNSIAALKERSHDKYKSALRAFESPQAFVKALETKETAYGHTEERTFFRNEDLDLTPPSQWTWAWYDFAAFWWSYGFSVGVWSVGSSMVALGLTWYEAIICVFISHTLGAIGIAYHSRTGARWHCGFPVECRVSWGMYASYFPVFVRLLVGCIWNAVNTLEGGYFTSIFLRCLFGHKWNNLTSSIPASADITVQELVGFILFVVITAPLLSIPVSKMRRVYTLKSVVLPPIAIGLFAFCIVQGNAVGSSSGKFASTKYMSGSKLAWAMLSAINSCMGKTSTQTVNQTDLARYARTPSSPFWSQLLALPIGNTLCATLGIFATSATQQAWGTTIWNPWDLCTEILDRHWTAGYRTFIAVVCLGFMLSMFASNIGVNVIPFGADVMAFCPRFLNIRRGMYLCYILGFIVFPWKILKTSNTFLRFLGGYSIFLAPLCGIFITDYYVVRKGNFWAKDLFDPRPGSAYWYHYGVSWRCVVAFTITVVVLVPGFAAQFGNDVGTGWVHLYDIGWVFGCTFSSVLYWALCQYNGFAKRERSMGWEEAYEAQGLFVDAPAEAVIVASREEDMIPGLEEKVAGETTTEAKIS